MIETFLIVIIGLREKTHTALKATQSTHISRRDLIDADSIFAESLHLIEEGFVLFFKSTDRSVYSTYVVMQELVSLLVKFHLISFFVIFKLPPNDDFLLIIDLHAVGRKGSLDITSHGTSNAASCLLLSDTFHLAVTACHTEGFPGDLTLW